MGIVTLIIIAICVIFIIQCNRNAIDKQESIENPAKENKKGIIKRFVNFILLYKETRLMISACIVIYFASTVLPSKIEIVHTVPNTTINHNFSYSPLKLELSDPGYPIKVELKNR